MPTGVIALLILALGAAFNLFSEKSAQRIHEESITIVCMNTEGVHDEGLQREKE